MFNRKTDYKRLAVAPSIWEGSGICYFETMAKAPAYLGDSKTMLDICQEPRTTSRSLNMLANEVRFPHNLQYYSAQSTDLRLGPQSCEMIF